eukprot:TRINITY_DN12743_c0_g1_i1.p1 TRINITY_DN12743_c0_g1~~TRINITY_DN12743_c0_g1_i1.p1  ORF type:complete len:317 (+),score=56.61 TRINITY_DN12743_c0_g1_i1:119-952(+)
MRPFLGPAAAWVILIWIGAVGWYRLFRARFSLREVPSLRWRKDYAAATLKYFGVEDLENLAYFEDIMDDTVVQPDEEGHLAQNWLLDCVSTAEGLVWYPGRVTAGSNFGYVIPTDSSVYYRLALRGVESCALLRVGTGLLLFWITSFAVLHGRIPEALLLGTAFLVARGVLVYIYCRRTIATYRMQPARPAYGPLATRLSGWRLLPLRLLQAAAGLLLLGTYILLLSVSPRKWPPPLEALLLVAGGLAIAYGWAISLAVPEAVDKQRVALGQTSDFQ